MLILRRKLGQPRVIGGDVRRTALGSGAIRCG